jgi:putative acetyltransferase
MIELRSEVATDQERVRRIHTLAFGGPIEAALVDRLRGSSGSISLVAVEAGTVVGHILFTAATVAGRQIRVAGLGPMAVDPARQRRGIGSELVLRGLEECHREGYEAVVVVGHADYYPRFGFQQAAGFGLSSEFAVPDELFMAKELRPGALSGGGALRYRPEFSET